MCLLGEILLGSLISVLFCSGIEMSFLMRRFINFNGKIVDGESPVIGSTDHSYRYGDGLFETMKAKEGRIVYADQHFERLFTGLKTLKFKIPHILTEQKLLEDASKLCEKNNCNGLARVRLSVSRGSGGLYDGDDHCTFLLECWPLEQNNDQLNDNGLIIDIFPDAKKSIDVFSNLKSANYLPYVMAAVWAKENKLNDALVLNSKERICDATIANVFWVKDTQIFTTPLSEGGVAGVMRRRILNADQSVAESILTEDILLNADEVFLSNVITGIRWVKQFRNKTYVNRIASKLFATLIQTN